MFCTVCGGKYLWSANHSWSTSRACGIHCHREFMWRETLSIMHREYYHRKVTDEEIANDIEMGYRDKDGNPISKCINPVV
jgi:hypothetical protein